MVTCLGSGPANVFDAASAGRSGIRAISRFDATNIPASIAGEVDDSLLPTDPTLSPQTEKLGYRADRLMRAACDQAAEQARLADLPDRDRVGCMIGSHGADPTPEEMAGVLACAGEDAVMRLPQLLAKQDFDCGQFYRRKPDMTTSLIASRYLCLGPTLSIVSACAAGAQAIGEAFRAIRRGQASAILCGGVEAKITYAGYIGFVLLKALCERYKTPETASRPFDRRRNGFVMSEGAAALVVEDLQHARKRNAPILGEILGYGDSADAYRITDVHPEGEGAIIAMKAALADARLNPDQVQYINAHGTSTKQNDAVESLAILKLFGGHAQRLPVSSNKSMLGHAIAAAGAIEAILTLEGIRRSILLPTINYESPDPKCPLPDYVPNKAREHKHSIALSNSFGFGGQNACLCLAAYRDE